MTSTTRTPVAIEIGEAAVVRIETLRARGRSARQIADDVNLDRYVVDEVFAWHDLLCGLRPGPASQSSTRRAVLPTGLRQHLNDQGTELAVLSMDR